MLDELVDQILGHDRLVGRLAFDLEIAASAALVEVSEPSALPVMQPSRISSICAEGTSGGELGSDRGALGRLGIEAVERGDHDGTEPVAGHGPARKS